MTLRACLGLTSDGEAIFVLPNRFFWSSTLEAFAHVDLSVQATFALPACALARSPVSTSNVVHYPIELPDPIEAIKFPLSTQRLREGKM